MYRHVQLHPVRQEIAMTAHTTPELDIIVLKQCVNFNPFIMANESLDALEEFPNKPATGRNVGDRVHPLLILQE